MPGAKYAALPTTGRKNAAVFVVFDVNTREEVVQLKKSEVTGWLAKAAIREREDGGAIGETGQGPAPAPPPPLNLS